MVVDVKIPKPADPSQIAALMGKNDYGMVSPNSSLHDAQEGCAHAQCLDLHCLQYPTASTFHSLLQSGACEGASYT